MYYVRLAKPAHSIQRSFFFVALVIATCVHYSPQHCWGFEAVSIREYIHGQKSENKNSVADEPPKLEPIQSSDIDEKTDFPLVAGNESGRIGVVGSIVEQIDSKPKNAADKKLDANKTEFEKTDIAPDKGKRKKKQRHGKVPLRYRSSVLERLRRYQTKLAEERRKKE